MSAPVLKSKSSRLLFAIVLIVLVQVSVRSSFAQAHPDAKALLDQMTLEEKIAQLSQLPGFPVPEFVEQAGRPEDIIRKYGAGSVLWVSDPRQINRLQHIAVDESRLHIPLLFGLDVIHGYHTIFPAPIAMASSRDLSLVEAVQAVAAPRWMYRLMSRTLEIEAGMPWFSSTFTSAWAAGHDRCDS
jgi:beta-glucosidase